MNIYTLTSPKLDGHIELQFDKGCLTLIKIAVKQPLNGSQFRAFMQAIVQFESDLWQLEEINLIVTKQAASNEKLALFCRLYEQHKGVKYQVSPRDAGMIGQVSINELILQVYFTSGNVLFKDKQSIGNLLKFYNPLLAEVAAAGKPKPAHEFPDHWNAAFHAKLTPAQSSAYYKHLHALGYRRQTDRMGNTIDWYKEVK